VSCKPKNIHKVLTCQYGQFNSEGRRYQTKSFACQFLASLVSWALGMPAVGCLGKSR